MTTTTHVPGNNGAAGFDDEAAVRTPIQAPDVSHPALLAAIHEIDSSDCTSNDEYDMILLAKARALMLGYHARYLDQAWFAVELERVAFHPLTNPATGASSRTWLTSTKTDGIISLNDGTGRLHLLEHKTTSEDIADPNAPYWRRLQIDSQVSHYALGQWQDGKKLSGTLYDVIRKPTIRPKRIVKGSAKKTAEENFGTWVEIDDNHTYFGFSLIGFEDEVEKARETGTETPGLYELRLSHDCLATPDKYFQRRPVPRLDSDLLEYANELWDVGQDMLAARNQGRHYRNSSHCNAYGAPCPYLGLCAGTDAADSGRWQRLDTVHRELDAEMPDGEAGGRSILTNSRIKMFQSCRRKHFYRYEEGLIPADDEEREALRFGTLVHAALEAWWGHYLITPKEKKNHDTNGHSGTDLTTDGDATRAPHNPAGDLAPADGSSLGNGR